jgi:PIN domain nuclease of toxin-antitoxin system
VRYLLDTHAFLWLATDDPQLTAATRAIFIDSERECFLSAASIWEMAIKSSLGKLVLATSLSHLVRGGLERGLRLLDVTASYALYKNCAPAISAPRPPRSPTNKQAASSASTAPVRMD